MYTLFYLHDYTKYIFDVLKDYIDTDCIIVFDELVNYPGFDGDSGEPTGMSCYYHEKCGINYSFNKLILLIIFPTTAVFNKLTHSFVLLS